MGCPSRQVVTHWIGSSENGPGRVCNLHGPMRYSRDIPEGGFAAASDSDAVGLSSSCHSCIDTQPHFGPMVQRTTTCALGAQNRGSNPRRPILPRLGIGDPSGLLLRSRTCRLPGSIPGRGVGETRRQVTALDLKSRASRASGFDPLSHRSGGIPLAWPRGRAGITVSTRTRVFESLSRRSGCVVQRHDSRLQSGRWLFENRSRFSSPGRRMQ